MMRYLLLAVSMLLLVCCKQPAAPAVTQPSANKPETTVSLKKPEPRDASSYTKFIDSFVSKKDIIFDSAHITAGQERGWSDEWGTYLKQPETFTAGKYHFRKHQFYDVNGDKDRRYYDADTAIAFSFHGRHYIWVRTFNRDCNGTWCMEEWQFICDLASQRVHVFNLYAAQDALYFGDINGDDQLDFLLPAYITANGDLRDDTTQIVSLTPYTLEQTGHFMPTKTGKGPCYIIGRFEGGCYDPGRFEVVGSNWVNWDDYRRR